MRSRTTCCHAPWRTAGARAPSFERSNLLCKLHRVVVAKQSAVNACAAMFADRAGAGASDDRSVVAVPEVGVRALLPLP